MKGRTVTTFSLSFLDCICCGLGAVILLFVLVNAKSAAQRDAVTTDLRSETNRLEAAVLEGKKDLVRARNALEETSEKWVRTQGLAREVVAILKEKKIELADMENDTLATKQHVNKLKADLKSLEEELKRLRAGAKTQDDLGSKLRPFPGQGDRQYLTDLKMGGKRILILIDASASMLDDTIVGVIRRRNLAKKDKLRSPKWQWAVSTIDWLTTRLPATSQFQAYTFNDSATPLLEGTGGTWLDAGDVDTLNGVVERLRKIVPDKGTSLVNALKVINVMVPAPDNVFLLIDSLPTMGSSKPWGKRISSKKRLNLFNEAIGKLRSGIPINIVLYPMEGDPLAASAYWRLAKNTRGSFFCPSKDWP